MSSANVAGRADRLLLLRGFKPGRANQFDPRGSPLIDAHRPLPHGHRDGAYEVGLRSIAAILVLPDNIALPDPRQLVPEMVAVHGRHPHLNVMNIEAGRRCSPPRVICSTNAIESLNARYHRAVRARGRFPTEDAAMKCLYLLTRSLDPTGVGRTRWKVR